MLKIGDIVKLSYHNNFKGVIVKILNKDYVDMKSLVSKYHIPGILEVTSRKKGVFTERVDFVVKIGSTSIICGR